ncbi:hypothetical protein [Clostridium cylindrosporum]|uniref:Uncharacterized protein n=1 Tax=Clostridium cylindrosporum DSM 605 TaxID=1121307 RepID=A0A0J8DFB6_CLOCY|nr:hypothetical protein [Clostridium cylindrosporum]KMT22873.1 hypothetical protein CLCY_5c01120 [Clostridium cylindrosporum DSM 605]
MINLKKKSLGIFMAALLTLSGTTVGLQSLNEVTFVQAISNTLSDAKAKTSHLIWSLHNNYLGLKNQAQWQAYIKEIRALIAKLPSSEAAEGSKLTTAINKAESLVNALARINQVEKSIASNTPRIGNVRQWNNYLTLGSQDLAKVDRTEFLKEINILTARMNKCTAVVTDIENKFNAQFDVAKAMLEGAQTSGNVDDAKKAFAEAEKLGTCEESNMLEYEGRLLLASLGDIVLTQDEIDIKNAYYKLLEALENGEFEVVNTDSSSISNAINDKIGYDIDVTATKAFSNPDKGEVLFDVVLSKGTAKLYPIGILFQ